MSEIEIEGADKQALDEKAESGDNLTIRIAVTTVFLAIIALIFSHFGEEMGDDAQDHRSDALVLCGRITAVKNDAAEARTQAGNQWAYFQAKSTKKSLAENVLTLASDESVKAAHRAKIERYDAEMAVIKAKAEGFDKQADTLNAQAATLAGKVDAHIGQAEALKGPEDQIKLGMPLMQIGIALASITALTRVRWMLWIAMLFAAVGIALSGYGIHLGKRLPDKVADWEKAHPDLAGREGR